MIKTTVKLIDVMLAHLLACKNWPDIRRYSMHAHTCTNTQTTNTAQNNPCIYIQIHTDTIHLHLHIQIQEMHLQTKSSDITKTLNKNEYVSLRTHTRQCKKVQQMLGGYVKKSVISVANNFTPCSFTHKIFRYHLIFELLNNFMFFEFLN